MSKGLLEADTFLGLVVYYDTVPENPDDARYYTPYTYYWRRDGQVGEKTIYLYRRADLPALLDKWNINSGGWFYSTYPLQPRES